MYDEACLLVDAYVRAAFWDKTPGWLGTDPADLERPHVEVCVGDSADVQLFLNPGQARAFAVALLRAAHAADATPVPPLPRPLHHGGGRPAGGARPFQA